MLAGRPGLPAAPRIRGQCWPRVIEAAVPSALPRVECFSALITDVRLLFKNPLNTVKHFRVKSCDRGTLKPDLGSRLWHQTGQGFVSVWSAFNRPPQGGSAVAP